MKYTFLLPIVAASFAFSACDKETSDKKAALEATADAKEKQAAAVKDTAKADAKATEAEGEAKAKEIKKEADAVRDQKPAQ